MGFRRGIPCKHYNSLTSSQFISIQYQRIHSSCTTNRILPSRYFDSTIRTNGNRCGNKRIRSNKILAMLQAEDKNFTPESNFTPDSSQYLNDWSATPAQVQEILPSIHSDNWHH